jgi:protein-S-isoprenylcysteine O-methyltransferase Ste14
LIYTSVFISVIVAYGFAEAGLGILPSWVFYLGVGMMVIGICLREWAVATLRGYFSYIVRVREDHKVIQKTVLTRP